MSVLSDSVRPHRRQPTRLHSPWDSPSKNTGVGCHFLLQCMKVKSDSEVAQSCLRLSDPMDCSLLGSSVHGILQARVLEWGAALYFCIILFYMIGIFCNLFIYFRVWMERLEDRNEVFRTLISSSSWNLCPHCSHPYLFYICIQTPTSHWGFPWSLTFSNFFI